MSKIPTVSTHVSKRVQVILALLVLGTVWLAWDQREISGDIRGVVTDGTRPLSGATVRIKTSKTETTTDTRGAFILRNVKTRGTARLTAWLDGFYIAGSDAYPGASDVRIALKPYLAQDTEDYKWIAPAVERSVHDKFLIAAGLDLAARMSFNAAFLPLAERLTLGCSDCHGETVFKEWADSAHALGASNIRFRTMYNGSDVKGNQSPRTRFALHRDYGRIPLRADSTQPYHGPGFKLDFPDSAGNCAACHVPTAALSVPYGTDPNTVSRVEAQGSHCDFCHKIIEVKLNAATGVPYENMPGILSLELRRPLPEQQLFFGPYDDVDVGPDTFSPLQRRSEFCAACHNASFWGTPIYQSFAEWQVSPYSDPLTGKTCQDCHMKPTGLVTNFAPGRGGLERDPGMVFSHAMPGAADVNLLQNSVTMTTTVQRVSGDLIIDVTIVNDKTGHHVPTDSPLRNVLLIVTAHDTQGDALPLREGATLPEWAGDYAGQPGKAFAKVLEELWTEISPSGAYWRATRILSDNRLGAFATDTSRYAFDAPKNGESIIEVKLIFRRAFYALMQQKGWSDPDIVMKSFRMTVP